MTRALVAGGLMVDAPGRPAPRFPQSRVPWVAMRVRETLEEWQIGLGTTVYTGGARGADVVIAEEAYERGAAVHLCLAQAPAAFEESSVMLPGTTWAARFRRLLRLAVAVDIVPRGPEETRYMRTNASILNLARRHDPTPYAIVVWNGRPGDGPGGTTDLVERIGYPPGDRRLRVIDPTPPRRGTEPLPGSRRREPGGGSSFS
ncbi:hypothetical protein AB0M02_11295 [Actinoplanes sp. NPDC051861]|uniref:hypothetical protein n=1 Tax=Actinoplanes sp. NPDC051861 TaxID=3155170 RepID=UPI003422C073